MEPDLLPQLRVHLAQYLNGKCSLQQFRQWFDVETWGMAARQDSPARQLAGEIELRLAEFTSGHLSEHDLQSTLQAFLDREQVADHASHKGSRR
jgi:hypothetical protein